MPVPNPPVLDTFTYADGDLDTANGTSWHNLASSPMSVWSNQAGPPSGGLNGNRHEMYRPLSYLDCEAAITLPAFDTTAHSWVYVRLQNSDNSTGWSQAPLGYSTEYIPSTGTVKLNFGSGSASTNVTLGAGDKICCRVHSGYQCEGWIYTGGAWHQVLGASDAANSYGSGRAGFSLGRDTSSSLARADDFAFGPYPSSSTTGTGSPSGFYPVFQVEVAPADQGEIAGRG